MGVMINNPSNVRVEGLSIRGFGLAVTAPPPEIGILVLQSRGVVLSRNSIFNVGLGIFVRGSRTPPKVTSSKKTSSAASLLPPRSAVALTTTLSTATPSSIGSPHSKAPTRLTFS